MSVIKTISFMEGSNIQPCKNPINIVDYVSGKHLLSIREALAKSDPIPTH